MVSFIHSWNWLDGSTGFPWTCQVCVDSEGCSSGWLGPTAASEPSELLQILRKGLAQPPGPSHFGVGEELSRCVCFFWGGYGSHHIYHGVMIEGLFQIGPSRIHQNGMLVLFFS